MDNKTTIAEVGVDGVYDEMNEVFDTCNDILDSLEHHARLDQGLPDEDQNLLNTEWANDQSLDQASLMNDVLQPQEKDVEERIAEEMDDHKARMMNLIEEFKNNNGFFYNQDLQQQAVVPQSSEMPPTADNFYRGNNFGSASPDSFYSSYVSDQTIPPRYAHDEQEDDMERSIDKVHIKVVSLCLQLSRLLDSPFQSH